MEGAERAKSGKKGAGHSVTEAQNGRKEAVFEKKERKFNNKRNNSFY